MALEFPFPVYGKVTNGLGVPITDRPVYIKIYDTRQGFSPKEITCDSNGYYQINIQDKIQDYGMTCHIEAYYYSATSPTVRRHFYFDVIKADMSKEVNFRISEQYQITDSKNISIGIL